MITTKTPLRVSFFGGGSDIPQYYNKKPGMVISTSIDKHIYIALNHCMAPHFKIIYSQLELVDKREDIKHDRVKAIMEYYGIDGHVELCSFSDIDTRGTGLGSSSTFTVGTLLAVQRMMHVDSNKLDLAELACHIEIDMCSQPIGKQDQYAAAFGGFNVIEFDSSGVNIRPAFVKSSTLEKLNDNLLCFNTGVTRQTSSILADQVKDLDAGVNIDATTSLVDIASVALKLLEKDSINDFGALLDTSWRIKKNLSKGISNPDIDNMYDIGFKAGALGGKLLGAGGGGYMLFYVQPEDKNNLYHTMTRAGYSLMNFRFTDKGSMVRGL